MHSRRPLTFLFQALRVCRLTLIAPSFTLPDPKELGAKQGARPCIGRGRAGHLRSCPGTSPQHAAARACRSWRYWCCAARACARPRPTGCACSCHACTPPPSTACPRSAARPRARLAPAEHPARRRGGPAPGPEPAADRAEDAPADKRAGSRARCRACSAARPRCGRAAIRQAAGRGCTGLTGGPLLACELLRHAHRVTGLWRSSACIRTRRAVRGGTQSQGRLCLRCQNKPRAAAACGHASPSLCVGDAGQAGRAEQGGQGLWVVAGLWAVC